MKRLSRIFLIINRKTLIITALAVISTYFCARLGIVADFPLTLIATAVVFPIVFSISGAYKRRTPRTLRTFSDFFITILPPLYGPYFAYIAQDYSSGLMYVMPILFSFILVSLDNIQAYLENPFDQIGEDDVMINVEKFVLRLDSRPAAT